MLEIKPEILRLNLSEGCLKDSHWISFHNSSVAKDLTRHDTSNIAHVLGPIWTLIGNKSIEICWYTIPHKSE